MKILSPGHTEPSASVSASALMLAPMLESGYDTDTWVRVCPGINQCGPLQNINADADADA